MFNPRLKQILSDISGPIVFQGPEHLEYSSNLFWDKANNSLGIGTPAPNASAILDVTSTTKGILIPRMTTVQRTAISSPSKGLLIYNIDTNAFDYWNSVAWAPVGTGTVTTFSAGNLSPLFSTTVSTPTTTPALSFTLSNAAANTWFGNNTSSSSAPTHNNAGDITKVDDTNITLTLGGTPLKSLLNSVSFTLGWTGQLAVSRGGTNISTYTAGDILYASATNVLSKLPIGADGQQLTIVAGLPAWSSGGTGTVTTFSAGNLSPLFSTTVSTPTTTPALSFTLSSAAANTWFGNNTGLSAIPSYNTAGNITKIDDTNITLTLGGTPTNSVLNSVSFTLGWTGTLAVSRGGTGTSTAFTPGSIVFAGLSGVYTQDNANFFWDDTNNRLGIRTNAPLTAAHIAGDTTIESVAGVFTQITSATINTTDATPTNMQLIPIPTNTVVMIEARVNSRKTGGAGSGNVGDGNGYIRVVKAKNVGGTVTIGAISSTYTSEDIAPFNATFAISGTNVAVRVSGAVNDNVTWTSTCIITR